MADFDGRLRVGEVNDTMLDQARQGYEKQLRHRDLSAGGGLLAGEPDVAASPPVLLQAEALAEHVARLRDDLARLYGRLSSVLGDAAVEDAPPPAQRPVPPSFSPLATRLMQVADEVEAMRFVVGVLIDRLEV